MSGSAQRARRLVSGGWILLVTPVAWLTAASLFLAVRPVTLLSPLVWALTGLWVGNFALGVLRAGRRQPDPVGRPDRDEPGVGVTAAEQPELWQLVRRAARAADLPAPDEVRLTATGHVTAWSGRRTRLDVGIPVLFVLDDSAVGALVARALAVLDAGWDTAEQPVDRFRWLLQDLSGRHLPSGVARLLLRRLDRQRAEGLLEADEVAATVAGRPTVGRALAWSYVVHAATRWWYEEFVVPEQVTHGQPRPLLAGLEALLGDPSRQRELMGAVSSRLPAGEGAVPGLADRVYGLQTGAELPDLLPGRAASELLHAPSTTLEQVAEAALGHTDQHRTWAEALDAWAIRTSHSSTAILLEHAPDLGAVLVGVAEKRLDGWVRDSARDPDLDADRVGRFLLTGLLASALVDAGVGRVTALWSGAVDVVDREGHHLDLPGVARTVVEQPDLVPDLRRMLLELGVPLDHRPSTGQVRPGYPLLTFHRADGARRLPGTGFPGVGPRS